MDRLVKEILKEGGPTVMLTSILGVLLGIFLADIRESLTSIPAMFLLIPVLMDISGDLGSIIGSRLTTSLSLGEVEKVFSRGFAKKVASEFLAVYLAALLVFIGIGGLGTFAFTHLAGLGSLSLSQLAALMGLSCLITAPAVAFITIVTSLATYTRGLDPDNFTIPLEATLADGIAIISLIIAARILGLL